MFLKQEIKNNEVFDFSDWKYYFGAILPATAPHKSPYLTKHAKKVLFKKYPKALFIRWFSDYDISEKTEWWYTIKDTPYDIENLKAKRRYEITKGRRFFEVKKISSSEYAEAIYKVYIESMKGYKQRDRISINSDTMIKQIENWDKSSHLTVFGSFFRETSQLCGFALIAKQDLAIHLSSLKTIPEFEKYSVNAALVDGILLEYNELLEQRYYICDGSRVVLHETKFQDYLEKYFKFRKAYCRLHICYRGIIGVLIKVLMPFHGIFKKFDNVLLIHKLNGILAMEKYKERQKNKGLGKIPKPFDFL